MENWAVNQQSPWLASLAFWLAATPRDDASGPQAANANVASPRDVPVLNWPADLFADEVSVDANSDDQFLPGMLAH